MKSFNQFLESKTQFRGNMDSVSGAGPSSFHGRDPQLQVNARQQLMNLFDDPDKAYEIFRNPEVRKILIPLLEKEPYLRHVMNQLSADTGSADPHNFGWSSATTRQPSDRGIVPREVDQPR